MRYLITGGCGFLGSNLALSALKNGHELIIFDNLSRVGSEKNYKWLQSMGKFHFIQDDIRTEAINHTIRTYQPDVIFHLAGQVAMTTSIHNPRLDFEINTLGSLNVLEAVRMHSPKSTIIYSSTNKVYGDLEQFTYTETATRYVNTDYPDGFDEQVTLDFQSPYGCSKGSADQYMLDFARIYGLHTIVFRHSSVFGTRQFSTFDQGWIGWFVKQALESRTDPYRDPFTISGNGKQVRDVLFSEDLIRCYYLAAANIEHCRGQAFNIGGGYQNSLSLLELFAFLEQELQVKLRYESLPPRQSDQKIFIANTKKAEKYFQWSPSVTKEQGLIQMIKWMSQNVECSI